MTSKYKLVPDEPTLVVWILYDSTTDIKYIKLNPTNGLLAIFNNEEAAIAAKRLHHGTDYKRCEYYSAPQPTPEVAVLVEALEQLAAFQPKDIRCGSEWKEWNRAGEYVASIARDALATYRRH